MTMRVLVVDGEVAVRRRLRVAVAREGFDADEAGDALTALHAIESRARDGRPFAAVLANSRLPDVDGLKLLSVVKSRYPDLRVVVHSGGRGGATPAAVQALGGDGFFQWPAAEDELTARLAGLVASRAEDPGAGPAATWIFLRLEGGRDPVAVFDALVKAEGVVYCDAIRDAVHHLALLLHAPNHEAGAAWAADVAARVPGIAAFEAVPVRPPAVSDEIRAFLRDYRRVHGDDATFHRMPGRATAYLLLDVDPGDLGALYACLYLLDEVVEIDAAVTGDRLILILQAADFEGIRRAASDRIRCLEGVVRIREMRVIPFERAE